MVITDGENVKEDASPIISDSRRQRSHKYIPDEMWLEILSRLPIESLLRSRCVCKLWGKLFYPWQKKIDNDPLNIPVCGLVFLPPGRFQDLENDDWLFSYFCSGAKTNFIVHYESPEEGLVYFSGIERGLLSESFFDFSIINNNTERQYPPYVLHGGLLLITLEDGTCEVYNPATNQIYDVQKSPIMVKYGFDHHFPWEKCGLIIQYSWRLHESCQFLFVRFCVPLRMMEVYLNVMNHGWRNFPLKLDDAHLFLSNWCLRNYVGFVESGVLYLYVLTTIGFGIAVKFKGQGNPETKQYSFPLPGVIEAVYNRKIWECEESLYLTYFNEIGLWIWKAGNTQPDAWTWVPMLEISPERQLCKPVGCKKLSIDVPNANVVVMPLACHPNVEVVYLSIKSCLFAYNLNNGTLDKIGEISANVDLTKGVVYTFKPCLSLINIDQV